MSRTYYLLLEVFPKPLANIILVIWYAMLILVCIYFIEEPSEEIIYWDMF